MSLHATLKSESAEESAEVGAQPPAQPARRSSPIAVVAGLAVALCLRAASVSAVTAPAEVLDKARTETTELEPALEAMRDGDTIDINTASAEALRLLPRVGPVLSQRIVSARPFESVDDLLEVRGIGASTLEALRPLIHVSPAQ